jgi:hypothetical protein
VKPTPPKKPARLNTRVYKGRGGARTNAGRKAYRPTAADRALVIAMSASGKTQEQIGPVIGKGLSDDTLRKHFPRELAIAKDQLDGICLTGIAKAMKKGNAWALCFYAKCRMGWKEKSALDEIDEIYVKRLVGVPLEDV